MIRRWLKPKRRQCKQLICIGRKAIMEMQFADFATVGFNQIINNLAKIYYRWGQKYGSVFYVIAGESCADTGVSYKGSAEAIVFLSRRRRDAEQNKVHVN